MIPLTIRSIDTDLLGGLRYSRLLPPVRVALEASPEVAVFGERSSGRWLRNGWTAHAESDNEQFLEAHPSSNATLYSSLKTIVPCTNISLSNHSDVPA